MDDKKIQIIDNQIERLKLTLKRLRAERRVAVIREQHRKLKSAGQGGGHAR